MPKTTLTGWLKKAKTISADKDKEITTAEYQAMLKKMARLEEENEILKKLWPYSQRSKLYI